MCRFLGFDRHTVHSVKVQLLPPIVFSIHAGRLTRNYTTFAHSKGTLWDPPGICSPWCWFHSASLPLHMLLTGGRGHVEWWPHSAITLIHCTQVMMSLLGRAAKGDFGRCRVIFHPCYFWRYWYLYFGMCAQLAAPMYNIWKWSQDVDCDDNHPWFLHVCCSNLYLLTVYSRPQYTKKSNW